MNFKKGFLLLTLTIMIVLSSFIFATGAGEDKYVMRIATFQSAKDSIGMACIKLGELIDLKSNERIEVSVVTDGEWGDERELLEMVRGGSLVEVSTASAAISRYVPEIGLNEFPFIYKDVAHQVRVLKAIRPYMEEVLAPFNLRIGGGTPSGFRHILNKVRPIYKVADLKGIKMRAPGPIYAGMFDALGASAITINWNEVYTALQSGVVDGMEASFSLIYANKFQEQAKYLSKTGHIAANNMFMICKSWFDSLPEDLQKIILESMDEAAVYGAEVLIGLDKIAEERLIAEGTKINEVDDINEFREKCIAFRENWVKEHGPEFEKLYNIILAVE